LDGLWILGMPQSKGLIAHKELGWELPCNTIGKKHKNDRYVKERKGGNLTKCKLLPMNTKLPTKFLRRDLTFLRCSPPTTLWIFTSSFTVFWKQGRQNNLLILPYLETKPLENEDIRLWGWVLSKHVPLALLNPNDTSLMKSYFELLYSLCMKGDRVKIGLFS
jgi:hypothetical protein